MRKQRGIAAGSVILCYIQAVLISCKNKVFKHSVLLCELSVVIRFVIAVLERKKNVYIQYDFSLRVYIILAHQYYRVIRMSI